MPQGWIEVNIVPVSKDHPERLLVDLIDDLVHVTFAGRLAAWFFGWYPTPEAYHLRLRIRWQSLERSDDERDELFAELNTAQTSRVLTQWWEGNHGTPNEVYEGEENTYGDLWELSYKDWQSSSELVLAMVKADSDNRLSEARQRQWGSRAHLHANRLGWNYYMEALVSLAHARFYLAEVAKTGPEIGTFAGPMDQRLEQMIGELAAGPPP